MKTLEAEWNGYRDKMYPDGVSRIQETESKQAFFAGAAEVAARITELAELPEAEGKKGLALLGRELVAYADARAKQLGIRLQ
jgi:hypothetical protein